MDLFSWIAGADPEDTPRQSNAQSHAGVYRRSNSNQAIKAKPFNPGIYAGGNGRARSGCLAGMRGFDPIEEVSTGGRSGLLGEIFEGASGHDNSLLRATRSLSPEKNRRHQEPFRPYSNYLLSTQSPKGYQYSSNERINAAAYGEYRLSQYSSTPLTPQTQYQDVGVQGQWESFFSPEGYAEPHPQAQTSPVREEAPKRYHQFRAAAPICVPTRMGTSTSQISYNEHVTAVETPPKDIKDTSNVTTPPKTDMTPSTSDHSDVDDLVPQSIHSPSDCDSPAPPSSGPESLILSDTRPHSLHGTGSGSDSSEKSQKLCTKKKSYKGATKEEAMPHKLPTKEEPLKKSPFASLELQVKDQEVVKARTCVRNAQMLNKSLTGECRSLEDEMSELTKDLEALRVQLKNRRGP